MMMIMLQSVLCEFANLDHMKAELLSELSPTFPNATMIIVNHAYRTQIIPTSIYHEYTNIQ